MKKLIALALAILMILSLAVVAHAADEEGTPEETRPTSGTITTVRGTITVNGVTIENGKPAATYAIYQILKLNSYDFTTGSYDYDYADGAWEDFFTTGAGKDYVGLNDKGILVWKGTTDAERVANFAKIALKYAEDNEIQPVKTTATPEGGAAQYTVSGSSIIFEDLELGYYLVDSTVGALCGLSTTNPDGLINSKNGVPTLVKQVQEDLGGQWDKTNTADIGQNVNFRITIHVHDGAQNYIIHDEMENGLKFNPGSVNVMVRDGSSGAETTYAPTTTVEKEGGESDTVINYEVIPNGDHEFEIEFSPSFCNGLNTNDRLVVTYSAMLTRNAEIGNGTDDDLPNTNTAHMHYGEGHYTNSDTTTTKTYGFDLVKTDGQNKLLDGAEFVIYSEEDGGYEITVVPLVYEGQTEQAKTPDGYYLYRKARADEAGQVIKVTDGMVRVVGLDNGVYWLEEKTHPSGYNPIETRQKFTIADNNLYAIVNSDKIVSTNSGVQVVNYTGTMLPETGGLGTLLFTILGGGTVLTSGVVLVTKKRMSKIEDED